MAGAWGLRQALVDELRSARCLTSARLEAAFRSVPRHLFLPHVPVETAYRNEVVPLRLHQGIPVSTASSPEIVAIMLEQLGLEPGHRVLEIGAGSGYTAGLIAEVVGRGGRVVTIDLDEDLAALARRNLDVAGFEHVRVVAGDGMLGDPDDGDFDRIIATVGAWDIAPAWRRQLAAGGRLVVPLSLRGPQRSITFAPAGERLHSTSIENCDFVWLRGELAGPGRRLPLGAASGLSVWLDDDRPVDPAALYARLRTPACVRPSGVMTTGPEVFGGLLLWLALHDPGYCEVFHAGSGPDADLVPGLFGVAGRYRRTSGVLAGDTLSLLGAPSELPCTRSGRDEPFELVVIGYEGGDAMAARLLAAVREWDAAGRRGTTGLRVRAEPVDAVHTPATGEIVIAKRWHRLALDWPDPGA